ncbi:MAG: hypothetical protein P1U40_10335 [Coxiellaceae bacterium]|nr:hypothetical protein [Coxiellaceae bacterium]
MGKHRSGKKKQGKRSKAKPRAKTSQTAHAGAGVDPAILAAEAAASTTADYSNPEYWSGIHKTIQTNLDELRRLHDFDLYNRILNRNRPTLFLRQDPDGKISQSYAKQSKLHEQVDLSHAEFLKRRWKRVQPCLKRNIEHLEKLLANLWAATVPLPKFFSDQHKAWITPDFMLSQGILNIERELMVFFRHKPNLPIEPLIIDYANYLKTKTTAKQHPWAVLESAIEASTQPVDATIRLTLHHMIDEHYISIISWGTEVTFPSHLSERSHAIAIVWFIICRLYKDQRIFLPDAFPADTLKTASEEFRETAIGSYAYLTTCDDEQLKSELLEAIKLLSRNLAKIPDGNHVLYSDLGLLMKIILCHPTVLGVTPHEHYDHNKDAPLTPWLKQAPQRVMAYAEKANRYVLMIRDEQRQYINRCVEAARKQAEEQEQIKARIQALLAKSPTTSETKVEDEPAFEDRPTEEPGLFPYLPDYEKQCCQIHLDLINLSHEVKKRVAHAIKHNKPISFASVNSLLTEMLETIDAIPDVDINHSAQKAIFVAGCYLQFLRGHLPFLNALEGHLVVVDTYTDRAMSAIVALHKDTEHMAKEYSDTLTTIIDEVHQCEATYLSAIARVYQRNKEKKANAKLRRERKGIVSKPKSREHWHPSSRTATFIESLKLIQQPAKPASEMFEAAPASLPPQHEAVKAKITEARSILATAAPVAAKLQSTLAPTTWLHELKQEGAEIPKHILFKHPEFLTIMAGLKIISPEFASRIRVHGGAIRDYLLTPDFKPNDWDVEYFGTYEELLTSIPAEYLESLDPPILHTDSTGNPVITTKLFVYIDSKPYHFDITLKPHPKDELAYAMSQPSNSDFNPNGLYTIKNEKGEYVIHNHQGSSHAKDVMQTVLSPLTTISHANLVEDPLLILRALRLAGEYKLSFSDALLSEMIALGNSGAEGKSFALATYPKYVQDHFCDFLHKHAKEIMSATILEELPLLQEALSERLSSDAGIDSFKSLGLST